MRTLRPNDISKFILYGLRIKLEKDFSGYPFRIFRERDLHACCYYHLRRFLRADRDWEVLNEPFLRGIKGNGKSAQPDIVLFRKGKPVFVVELKFRRRLTGVQRKDQRVLNNAVKRKKWAKKAYYIEAVIKPSRRTGGSLIPYRTGTIPINMRDDRREEYLARFKRRRKPEPRIVK